MRSSGGTGRSDAEPAVFVDGMVGGEGLGSSDPLRLSEKAAKPSSGPELGPDVLAWIADLVGGGEVRITPVGHHRPLWSIDVIRPGETVELFVRGARDSGSVLASVYNLEREASVLRALTEAGVSAPAFVGLHRDRQLLVLKRVPGGGDFRRIGGSPEGRRVAGRFIEVLADMHAREVSDFELDAVMKVPVTAEEHALGELVIAEPLYDAADLSPEPVITFGRQWLRRNIPQEIDHTCLIQGDTGPGNFVFDGDRVWLVDFEIAHFGDPMEDLAAVCIRDMVTPFGDLRSLFAQYESLTTWRFDIDRLRYHRVSKCVRSLMAIVSLAELGWEQADRLIWWAYRALYVRSACQALAEAMGLDFAEVRDPAVDATSRAAAPWNLLHELLEADLADLSQSSHSRPDAEVAAITRASQAAAVLARAESLGPGLRSVENSRLEQLLGSNVGTNEDGIRQLDDCIRAGTLKCDEIELLKFLTRRADAQCMLWRPAMGAMADGRFSAVGTP